MDTLRATNLSSMLNPENDVSVKSSKVITKLDKDNVSKLVRTFSELNKHEKILFLINIRTFCNDNNNGGVTPIVQIKQEGSSCLTTTAASTSSAAVCSSSSSSSTSSTPQAQRLSRTSNWLQKTFIQDTQVALPKEEVYSLYKSEFTRVGEKAISTADFGKLMRQVFPDVKARRLGQRGQSKYCYANIRKRSETERPTLPNILPQNELIQWAKNKFNIDFTEVSQVVSYLKCDSTAHAGRKRRASCGGNLLKQSRTPKNATRSASVSVLELKEDPLMVLHDNDSTALELNSYFQESNPTQWPQLRSLLTDDSNSSFSGNFSSAGSVVGNSSKKKRHSSSVQFEFIKPELQGSALMHNRSQSVPVPGNSHQLDDELQSTSTSSIFDELSSGAEGVNNPLFSSAATSTTFKSQPVSSTSSTSSSTSSVMFESIDISVANGLGSGSIGVDINASGGNDVVGGMQLLSNGAGHVGNDVFFDSVFDLMMNDCQN